MTREDSNNWVDQYLKNSQEFNDKLKVLKALKGSLETALTNALLPIRPTGQGDLLWEAMRKGSRWEFPPFSLRISWSDYDNAFRFTLYDEMGIVIERNNQLTIRMVRKVWENRGAMFELVWILCASIGRCAELQRQLARFED